MGAAWAADLWLVGHSLGGAVATLIALELAAAGRPPQAVVAFGCPRVGYAETPSGAEIAATVPVTRVNTLGDPIPSLPPATLARTLGGEKPFGHVDERQLVLCGRDKYAFLPGETAAQAARSPARDGFGDALTYATEGSFENAPYLGPHAMAQYVSQLAALVLRERRDADAKSAEDLWLDVVGGMT